MAVIVYVQRKAIFSSKPLMSRVFFSSLPLLALPDLMHTVWHFVSLSLRCWLMLFPCSPWKKSVLIWLHGPNVLSDRRDEKEMHLQIGNHKQHTIYHSFTASCNQITSMLILLNQKIYLIKIIWFVPASSQDALCGRENEHALLIFLSRKLFSTKLIDSFWQ